MKRCKLRFPQVCFLVAGWRNNHVLRGVKSDWVDWAAVTNVLKNAWSCLRTPDPSRVVCKHTGRWLIILPYSSSLEAQLRATEHHLPYTITQYYIHHCHSLLLNMKADTHFAKCHPPEPRKLSWSGWMALYQDSLPACRQSPTGS